MRRWIIVIILSCLLAVGTIICVIRWEAWFSNPPEPEWVGEIINHEFLTFANDSISKSLQKDTLDFLILGDIHNLLTNEEMLLLSNRHRDIDFWAQLGDWMERPYLYYYQMLYHSIIGTNFDSLPIVAIPGNHEYLKGIKKVLPEQWKSVFPNPLNGPLHFLGSSYYVDFPHLRIVAIDTDGLQRLSDYTQVCFWLNTVLNDASNIFTIVLMHHPIYSTAKGRQNPLLWFTFRSAMRNADVVFSGHDHNYARHTVNYKKYGFINELPTTFITTNASKKNYENKEYTKFEMVFSGEPIYQYLHTTPSEIYIQTRKLFSGELIDSITIQR